VNPEPTPQDLRRRHSSVTTDSWRLSTHHESQLLADSCKLVAARTVESLTNEMVSSIIGEVTQRRESTERLTQSGSDTRTQGENDDDTTTKDAIAARYCIILCYKLDLVSIYKMQLHVHITVLKWRNR